MYYKFPLRALFIVIISAACLYAGDNGFISQFAKQLKHKDDVLQGRFPQYTQQGEWKFSKSPSWLIGFTGGELWNLYALTNDEDLKVRALKHADSLLQFADLDNTHDLGFIFFPSVVKAYQITGNAKYRDAAVRAAKMIAKRFNDKGNYIRAWGAIGSNDRDSLMIIDTMLNIELLFWAAQITGDYSLYDIAYKHAITCMRENVRPDYTSYHVIRFDPRTGKVVQKRTHQGAFDESTWARGQAWGIYGFALAYKYTHDERFLNTSEKMADVFLSRLPGDAIPYWDLDLKGDTIARDASAAAIAASGMELLTHEVSSPQEVAKYKNAFLKIAESLKANYTFLSSKRKTEQGLLIHTVYNYAKGWGIDESFPCGDYYLTEVLEKYFAQQAKDNFIQNTSDRREYRINENWEYLEDNAKLLGDALKSPKLWKNISLPHTWNTSDIYDLTPGYRRDASWYKKEFFLAKIDTPMQYILSFEAVNIQSEVYVNGQYAGGHVGGFIGFDIDITPFIKYGAMNQIMVRADNSVDINVIPSQKADFSIMGGIPRNVWLKVLPETHIGSFHITTPQVSKDAAKTHLSVFVVNKSASKEEFTVLAQILGPDGDLVTEKKVKQAFSSGIDTIEIQMPDIKKPQLWSPAAPNLYTVKLTLKNKNNAIDVLSDKCGYRWYEFKEKGPFYLNGERLLLRGTHRHEELSGYGNAIPDSLHRKEITMIKELGANFVRLAHYPQNPEVYKACDELGILVWDEVPWCRGGMGGQQWQDNTSRLLKEQISMHMNHPSIILWSLGNESDWLPDFPNGDNMDSLKAFVKVMYDIAKKLDPARPTTARKFEAASKIVDVYSPSIWPGWYSTVYKEYDKVMAANHEKYPRLFHAEYGGDSHPGRHTDSPISGEGTIPADNGEEKANQVKVKNIANDGDWSESYIVNLFDWYLKSSETNPWLTGSAQWIFRDFSTPLRPEDPIPYMNQKGLVDQDGNPKDAYYVFKSYWTTNPKFCYIESHTWTFRTGAKNQKRNVKVFSNCEEVELFLNGVSQGRLKKDIKAFPASGLLWSLQFAEGKNTLLAKGFDGGKDVTVDSVELTYTTQKVEKAEDIQFSQQRLANGNYLITATVVDGKGKQCVDFNRFIYFSNVGSGKFVAPGGSPTTSQMIQAANGIAKIQIKTVPLEVNTIEVRTQELKGAYYTIQQ
jgi:beta-galactosidase